MGKQIKNMTPTRKCLFCGQELEDKDFYKSNGSVYSGNGGFVPVCKGCLKRLYERYNMEYESRYSVFDAGIREKEIQKLAVRRVCMAFDVYYSDTLFEAALKNQKKFPALDLMAAYMKMTNLKQNKRKTYDTTIAEENLSQELVKHAAVNMVNERFNDNELRQDIYELCLKLLQTLRKEMQY